MWLCTNYGFFSIVLVNPNYANVGDNAENEIYAVRARQKSHLEQAFKDKKIFEYSYSGYEYRSYLTQEELNDFLLREASKIDYTNFKNSIRDNRLHDFFTGIWRLGVKFLSYK